MMIKLLSLLTSQLLPLLPQPQPQLQFQPPPQPQPQPLALLLSHPLALLTHQNVLLAGWHSYKRSCTLALTLNLLLALALAPCLTAAVP